MCTGFVYIYVCSCFSFVQVKALNEMTTIGKISKYWSGFVNNVFTNTANFGIQVPVDLDVRIKAVMIGACFLIVSGKVERQTRRGVRTRAKGPLLSAKSYKSASALENQTPCLTDKLTKTF